MGGFSRFLTLIFAGLFAAVAGSIVASLLVLTSISALSENGSLKAGIFSAALGFGLMVSIIAIPVTLIVGIPIVASISLQRPARWMAKLTIIGSAIGFLFSSVAFGSFGFGLVGAIYGGSIAAIFAAVMISEHRSLERAKQK